MTHYDALDNILHRPEIVDSIFASLSPANAVRFQRVARVTRDIMHFVNGSSYSIYKHLRRFFVDPLDFRSLQARTGTIISGSNALQFLDRTCYPGSDMDLYTHPGHTKAVGKWLIKEGYIYEPQTEDDPLDFFDVDFDSWTPWITSPDSDDPASMDGMDFDYSLPGIRGIYHFVKYYNGEQREIQIMATVNTPIQCILAFHSSTCSNPTGEP